MDLCHSVLIVNVYGQLLKSTFALIYLLVFYCLSIHVKFFCLSTNIVTIIKCLDKRIFNIFLSISVTSKIQPGESEAMCDLDRGGNWVQGGDGDQGPN